MEDHPRKPLGRKYLTKTPVDELLNYVQAKYGFKLRAEAILKMGTDHPTISKIRNGYQHPTAEFILRTHDRTDIPLYQIRQILGVKKL